MAMRRQRTHVLCDASSALLLFKAGIIEALFNAVRLVFPRTVYAELTNHLRPGAEQFIAWYARQYFLVVDVSEEEKFQIPLHGGEQELILLYLEGRGKFLIFDDKKAATYCRRHAIPYLNALLVPRLLLMKKLIPLSYVKEPLKIF